MSFKSVMKTIAEDIKKGLDFLMPWAQTAGVAAVSILDPAAAPMYKATVAAVLLAEHNAIAAGQQKNGPQKFAAVLGIVGSLVGQGLADAGQTHDQAAVEGYVNSVVKILNTTPAPAGS